MSKASEWVEMRPTPFCLVREDITVAMVDEVTGGMLMNEEPKDRTLTPMEALQFAHWIIATFG